MAERDDEYRSPDYGGKWGYGVFHALIRWFGPTAAYLLLLLIAPFYAFIHPAARHAAAPYLKRRFPGISGPARLLMTARYYFRFGQVLVDRAAAGILGQKRLRVEFPEEDELYRLAHEGRGLILLTTHAGNWQTAMFSLQHLDKPVHLQFQLERRMTGRHAFDLAGGQDHFRFISPHGFLGGMVELTNALGAGECVAVMGDRSWGARTARATFLGASAEFPAAAYHLAAATGAEVVALLAARTGALSCRLELRRLTAGVDLSAMSREETVRVLLKRYVEFLEEYLDKRPLMWFNFFDLWGGQDLGAGTAIEDADY